MNKHIAIVTDDPGWHGSQLKRAFRARDCECSYISLMDCRIDFNHGYHGIVIPGFKQNLPDGVFVRGVPGGTLEQVILRLDVLHALQELGIPVYNNVRAVERSVDKAMTSFLLKRVGIPTPVTWVTESAAQARAILMRETAARREVVIKPLFGSQGIGLQRLSAGMDIPEAATYNNVYYMQSFVARPDANWHDWRVLVIGGKAVAAMIRRGRDWINNVAQGARCEKIQLEEPLARLAIDATRAVGMDYAGVDILKDTSGQPYVIEVNSIPAWKGLQGVTDFNIAQFLADDLVLRRMAPNLVAV